MLRTNIRYLHAALTGGSYSAASSLASRRTLTTKAATASTSTETPTQPQRRDDGPQQDGSIRTHFARSAKKPARPPLVRNFFAGQVDTEQLTYPEVISRDDMVQLNEDVHRTEQFVGARTGTTNFGLDIPVEYGGRGFGQTETARIHEVEAQDVCVALPLAAHRQCARMIVECGTAEQKERFLPRLATGELTGTIAFYERVAPDQGCFSVRAKLDDNVWTLTGEKSCVCNATDASVFVVFAQTLSADKCGDLQDTVTAFLVERGADGVEVLAPDATIGTTGVPQASIQLNNVRVAADQVLGDVGGGTEVAQRLLRHSRLQSGIAMLALMKRILARLTAYCVDTTQFGVRLTEVEKLRDGLAHACSSVYALESMIYLTAGISDAYEAADIDVETAIVRIFAQQNLLKLGTMALDFMGPRTLLDGEGGAEQLRDALQLYTNGESVDSLLLFVGLSGMQHAGASLHEVVKKVRNPLLNPSFIFKRLFETQNIESPNSTLHLAHHLHPTLDPAAQWLEHSILRLQTSTEILLSRYGVAALEKQVELQRLSESAIRVYAAFASIGRASRSYCIGLQHADHELLTASAFTFDTMQAVKRRTIEIRDGPYMTNDTNRQKIAGHLFKCGGYFAAHPLLRNF